MAAVVMRTATSFIGNGRFTNRWYTTISRDGQTEQMAFASRRFIKFVTMGEWRVKQRDLFKMMSRVIVTERIFRYHFNFDRNGAVPIRNTILRRVEVSRTTRNIMMEKKPGFSRTTRTP